MFLVTDREGVDLMEKNWFCVHDQTEESKEKVILSLEIGTTQLFVNHGWNIASMQLGWRGHNFLDFNRTNEKCHHNVFADGPIIVNNQTIWVPGGRYTNDGRIRSADPYEGGEVIDGIHHDIFPE